MSDLGGSCGWAYHIGPEHIGRQNLQRDPGIGAADRATRFCCRLHDLNHSGAVLQVFGRGGEFELCGQQFGLSVSDSHQPKMPDFVKPGRQHMLLESPDKLSGVQSQHFFLVVAGNARCGRKLIAVNEVESNLSFCVKS